MRNKFLIAALLALNSFTAQAQNTPLLKYQPGPRLIDGNQLNLMVDRVNSLDIGLNTPLNTSIVTVGAGTLTAAGLIGGVVTRTGPTSAFTDTTATGALIDASMPNNNPTAWIFEIKNSTAFVETLAGGTGVTLSGRTTVQPNSVGQFLVTKSATATYTMYGIGIYPQAWENSFGLIATADNGTTQTLTAAMVTGGKITYHTTTGGTTPSLTLPLATAIDTALPDIRAGQSYVLRVINSNSGTATIVTNTGWTTSGTLTIATNTWREFLVTCTTTQAGVYAITSVGTGTNS